MNNFNELKDPKEEQNEFNKKFLIKLTIFMFLYRFYIMHIDQKGVMVDFAENCINDLSSAVSKRDQELIELELDNYNKSMIEEVD